MNFPDWDRELFVFLNSKHIPWLDEVMTWFSSYLAWGVVALTIVLVMVLRDRTRGKRAALYLVLSVGLTLFLNNLVKWMIMRPRPGHEELLKELINQLEDPGKSYSFFSAHSSSSFCLAMFTALYFRNKIYTVAIFAWSMAVAYSRIYVGKHYPLDVAVGILFGLLMGWGGYRLYQRTIKKGSPV